MVLGRNRCIGRCNPSHSSTWQLLASSRICDRASVLSVVSVRILLDLATVRVPVHIPSCKMVLLGLGLAFRLQEIL